MSRPLWDTHYTIWHLEFFLDVSQHCQLVTELQRGQHGVLIGQGEVGRTGQSPVGVDSGSGVAERVKLLLVVAGVTAAEVVVGRMDPGSFAQQGVNDLILLAVSRQDQRCDVMRKPAPQSLSPLNTLID